MPRKIQLRKEKGFSLLLIVLIFAGLAVVSISAATFTAKIKNISLEKDTVKQLAIITDAIKRYYRARESLPSSPAGTEVPVGLQDLNLDQKFRHDAWGRLLEYDVDESNVPGSGLTAFNVEGRNVAGYILSYGTNQTKETNTGVSPIIRGGDDILRPINVQAEARDIALDELTLISKKACAYWSATGSPAPDVDPTLINHFSLSDKYKLDPWGNSFQPNPDVADNNFYSDGPSGPGGPASDNIYGPPVLAAQCQGSGGPSANPIANSGLWGGTGMSIGNSSNVDGPVGSGAGTGSFTLSNYTSAAGIHSSGSSVIVAPNGEVVGDILACGDVEINGEVTGDVHSHATVEVFPGATVTGNIYADGDVTVKGTVNGNVDAGGTADTSLGTVTGTVTQGAGATPPTIPTEVCSPTVPPLAVFTVGTTDITIPNNGSSATPITPGEYRNLSAGQNTDIYLTSAIGGIYTFNTLDIDRESRLYLDLSQGGSDIQIFVNGDVDIASNNAHRTQVFVRYSHGGTYYNVSNVTLPPTNPAYLDRIFAAHVYLETHGQFSGGDYMQWFGGVLAANGLQLGSDGFVVGQLVSLTTISVGNNTQIIFVPSNYAIDNW